MPDENAITDLPSMAEVDQALQELFAEVTSLRTEISVLKDLLGAAIASGQRTNASKSNLTGL
jgi:hypothetical protein